MAAFQAAAANADFSKVQDFYLILTNQPGAASWPITAADLYADAHRLPGAAEQGSP